MLCIGHQPNGSDRRLRERRQAYEVKANIPNPKTTGMRKYLGPVMRKERQAARARLGQVSQAMRDYRSDAALSRFERGETWPDDIDRVLQGYAEVTRVSPRVLW